MFTFYPYPAFLEFAGLDQDVEREVSGGLGCRSGKKPLACFKNLYLPPGINQISVMLYCDCAAK